jgi:glycosyltransferase involved in cell wall biosynthesis
LGAIYRRLNRKVVIIGHYPNRAMAVEGAPVFARSQVVLIYIGRLSVDRGLLVYADLLRTLCEWGIPARLWLCGVFTPPDEENRLRERCRGLEDVLDVLGWVHYSQVPALLRDADVGLAILQPEPRYVAALPVNLFEYMAAGLPVVASDFPQIAAVLDDAQCGIPVDPLDSRAVANRIRHWWEHPDEARTKGESGRQAVLDRYNWEVLAQRLEDLYDSLLE